MIELYYAVHPLPRLLFKVKIEILILIELKTFQDVLPSIQDTSHDTSDYQLRPSGSGKGLVIFRFLIKSDQDIQMNMNTCQCF